MGKLQPSELLKKDVKIQPLHCGISVPDLDLSINWYREMLDFTLDMRKYLPILNGKVAFLSHGNFSIELFELEGANPLPVERRIPNLDIQTHGTKHIAFAVENIKDIMETLKEKNVDIAMDITIIENDFVAFIRDNSGNLIELIQRPDYF